MVIKGDKNHSVCGHVPTWHTGDAKDVGVAHKEALQDVSRLVGVNDDNFSGGLGAGADPNQRRHFILLAQFLLPVLCKKKKKHMFFFFSFQVIKEWKEETSTCVPRVLDPAYPGYSEILLSF